MTRSKPPKPDEFEVSIIGPGRGECVLIHLGENDWCIVDSCIARGQSEPVAFEYLSSFENGAVERVRLILATHWHDDHVRGMASLLKRVPSADFYCSMALRTDEFLTLVGSAEDGVQGQSGVDEFASILEALRATRAIRGGLVTPKYAIANRPLLDLPANGRSFPVKIIALSPSDATITLAHAEIASLIPKPGQRQIRIPSVSANHTSVALWIEVGPLRVLLGADLLHSDQPGEGWSAVLANHRAGETARLLKVPHHGSTNADCPDVWTRMLDVNPIAVVTPFSSGTPLPKRSDLQRLGGRTENLYCTSKGGGKEPPRPALVGKMMRERLIGRHVVEGQPGHVRVRWPLYTDEAKPNVEVFNGAYRFEPHGNAA